MHGTTIKIIDAQQAKLPWFYSIPHLPFGITNKERNVPSEVGT